jgi:hypothetical protein
MESVSAAATSEIMRRIVAPHARESRAANP